MAIDRPYISCLDVFKGVVTVPSPTDMHKFCHILGQPSSFSVLTAVMYDKSIKAIKVKVPDSNEEFLLHPATVRQNDRSSQSVRIHKELKDLQKDPPASCSVDPSDGKLYYGIATFKEFYIFDYGTRSRCCEKEDEDEEGLKRFKISGIDIGHAFLSLIVFLVFAISDTDVQSCLFPESGANMNVLLMNLQLSVGVLASFRFTIFPTTRRGLGYKDFPLHTK
ncbi:Protein of unknown function DUF679 [Cynara cardunculus var. scolymus]|uniref:Uncharacterized protein n=1 Tax=Cynara cardunculus var. scolymus TaxID=59895 RepID=A0A103T4X1_CYNCS|nr:Protein of unknown function DUF679 [Cynara cardunculus var. scolymus]